MRGICIIDRQPGCDTITVRVTSRTDPVSHHTNAVVIDIANDPR